MRLLMLSAVALAWSVSAGDLVASEIPTSMELLRILRAKDGRFDNVKLQYVHFGVATAEPFSDWDDPWAAEMAVENGWDKEKRHDFHFRYMETMIVRGRHVTFIREADPTFSDDNQAEKMVPYQKWSNTEGMYRQLIRSDGVPTTLWIDTAAFPVDLPQEQAMGIEFAFGFGFGKRIKTIDHIEQDGSRLRIDGTIRIWWEDESRFQMVLDDHSLVREAEIESNVKGNHTRFEVKTEGSVAVDGFEFAKTGSFTRIGLGVEVDGKLVAKPVIVMAYQTEFKGIQSNLSDETYQDLVAMEPEPGTQVSDLINDRKYTVGDEENARPLRPRIVPQNPD